MWARAEENIELTWKFLGLFFNDRGARAMVEHFEQMKAGGNIELMSAS